MDNASARTVPAARPRAVRLKTRRIRASLPLTGAIAVIGHAMNFAAHAQDPNFHVYLGFGQSNMEGITKEFSGEDLEEHPRFRVLSAVACPDLGRTPGRWGAAKAPLVRCNTGLSPLDHFGRALLDSLPPQIRVGIVPVAVAGTRIEGFDKSGYLAYYAGDGKWLSGIVAEYDGNPYARLVSLAEEAKKTGVIKGILMHQGESNKGESDWPSKVRKIYFDLLTDLQLDSLQVPLLVGEVVGSDQNGGAASHNAIVARVPSVISTARVVSSRGCTALDDNLHFDSPGAREMGRRYARTMLGLLETATGAGLRPPRGEEGISAEEEVYDLRGSLVARIAPTDPVRPGPSWSRAGSGLPAGVYWLRDARSGKARKVVNGR